MHSGAPHAKISQRSQRGTGETSHTGGVPPESRRFRVYQGQDINPSAKSSFLAMNRQAFIATAQGSTEVAKKLTLHNARTDCIARLSDQYRCKMTGSTYSGEQS